MLKSNDSSSRNLIDDKLCEILGTKKVYEVEDVILENVNEITIKHKRTLMKYSLLYINI